MSFFKKARLIGVAFLLWSVLLGYSDGGLLSSDVEYLSKQADGSSILPEQMVSPVPQGGSLKDDTHTEIYEFAAGLGDKDSFGMGLSSAEYRGNILQQYFSRTRIDSFGYDSNVPFDSKLVAELGVYVTNATNQHTRTEFLPLLDPPSDGSLFFESTGHTLADPFRQFWVKNGGSKLLGDPISEPIYDEQLTYQWFSKARIEVSEKLDGSLHVVLADLGLEYSNIDQAKRDDVEMIDDRLRLEDRLATELVVPILYYHEVPDTVSFEKQLAGLLDSGMTPIPLARLVSGLEHKVSVPRDSFVVTFDDGLVSQYRNALPVLLRLRVPATFFVMPGFDRLQEGYMKESQVKHLISLGMDVGSHTFNHANVTSLVNPDIGAAQQEVDGSRKALILLGAGDHFAYPYGMWDHSTEQIVVDSGYNAAVVTQPRVTHKTDSRFKLGRVQANASGPSEIVLKRIADIKLHDQSTSGYAK